jgi:dihydroorotate dehydrogenase
VWNNIGLANPGFDWWINKIIPRLDAKIPLLVSLYPSSLDFIKEAALTLSEQETIKGIELNFSCPNVNNFTLEQVSGFIRNCKYLKLPVVLKLNAQQVWYTPTLEFKRFLDQVGPYINAISLNSVPVRMIHNSIFKTGAISGRRVAELNWNTADKIRNLGFDNVIYPSIWSYEDMINVKEVHKAKAVSFGSVHLLRPAAPSRWIMQYVLEGRGPQENK